MSLLERYDWFPKYIAVRVFVPDELKTTEQLPVPDEFKVIVQLVFAPVMSTVPVGTVEPPVTLTLTITLALVRDGSGVSAVIVVVVSAGMARSVPHRLN